MAANEKKKFKNKSDNDLDFLPTLANDSQEDSAEDFETLLQYSAVKGSNFQFESEKKWKTDTSFSNPFQLNLKTLEDGLSSIIFYERHNLSSDLFSEKELEAMRKNVKPLPKEVSTISDSSQCNSSNVSQIGDKFTTETIDYLKKNSKRIPNESKSSDTINKMLETNIKTIDKLKIKQNERTEDLEDWLDSILDD